MAVIETHATRPSTWQPGWQALKEAIRAAFTRLTPPSRRLVDAEMLSQLQTLQRCFAILDKQVHAAEQSSMDAVTGMVTRLQQIHERCNALQRELGDAAYHSRHLSDDTVKQAQAQAQALSHLSQQEERFVNSQRAHTEVVQLLLRQVDALSPSAALIADVAKQTNLLAINAAIEAAHAGHEGAGFKIVAAEVRRLSQQTGEAAAAIAKGIEAIGVTHQLASQASDNTEVDTSVLAAIGDEIREMGTRPGVVACQLKALSVEMEASMQAVRTDLVDVLGHMQFQDVNRQLLECVSRSLNDLSAHCQAIEAQSSGGRLNPKLPKQLADWMKEWEASYVMAHQRGAHESVTAGTVSGSDGPKIEMF